MRARCNRQSFDDASFPELTVGNSYRVLGIEADEYRIISDEGLPFLYPAALFEIADASEDPRWVTEYGASGERYSYPPELNAVGFFEDFFENKPEAVAVFRKYVAGLFRGAAEQ